MQRKLMITTALVVMLAAACNVGATPAPTMDVNAINTAAFNTAMAQISSQQTQAALAAPSATSLPANTLLPLATLGLPTAGGVPPTAGNGAIPTLSFNITPNTTPVAGFTQIATSRPAGSSGQASTASGCNDALFVGETLPDGSVVKAGDNFVKGWELKNTGTCDWDEGYAFAFQPDLSSSAIQGYDIVIKSSDDVTKPGHSQSFVIKLTAPSTAGEYKGYWKLKTGSGVSFGPLVYFDIVVK
jgi:hypothetical protein